MRVSSIGFYLTLALAARGMIHDAGLATPEFANARSAATKAAASMSNDFGLVKVGERRTQSVVLFCNSPVVGVCSAIGKFESGGADLDEFLMVGDTCTGNMMSHGASCRYDFTFTPRRPVGFKSATVTLFDGAGSPYLEIEHIGKSTTGPDIAIKMKGGPNFGAVVVGSGESSGPRMISVENRGNEPVTIFGADDCAPEFTFFSSTVGLVILPNESIDYFVYFIPMAAGQRECSVRFSASDQTLTEDVESVSLKGRGVARREK